ncbi:MAG: hypothetical protein EAY66_00835, partial [Sphingobacteriales bacterium]
SSFYFVGNDVIPAFQVDLLIDRNDGVINLCEMKYYASGYVLTKKDVEALKTKAANFQILTKTKKRVVCTLITTHKLKPGMYQYEIDESLCLEDVFG